MRRTVVSFALLAVIGLVTIAVPRDFYLSPSIEKPPAPMVLAYIPTPQFSPIKKPSPSPSPATHLACIYPDGCVPTPGAGPNECTGLVNDNCAHYGCSTNWSCDAVFWGEGEDECDTTGEDLDNDCRHLACVAVGGTYSTGFIDCQEQGGEGADYCVTYEDCYDPSPSPTLIGSAEQTIRSVSYVGLPMSRSGK